MLDVISDVTAVLPALNGTTQVDGHILAGNGANIFMILQSISLQIFKRWEMDCPLDRYCMKISGVVQDAFGYGNQVSVRGCPWISLLTRLEEGCTRYIKYANCLKLSQMFKKTSSTIIFFYYF